MIRRFLLQLALPLMLTVALRGGCEAAGLMLTRWIERPNPDGPSLRATPEESVAFSRVMSYAPPSGSATGEVEAFEAVRAELRQGDLVAYHMPRRRALRAALFGQVNKLGYAMLEYGHLALVVRDPRDAGRLVLFSSEAFVGPNTREDLETLRGHAWDVYRLDAWEGVDTQRLNEFVALAETRAGGWYGYDFSGMFGLWNSNLTPGSPAEVGHDYICSTAVVAALHYAGLELDAVRRGGMLDLCSLAQVVRSRGRLARPAA